MPPELKPTAGAFLHAGRVYLCSMLALSVKPVCRFTVGPSNPAFFLPDPARLEIEQRLRASHQPLARPVVVLSGYRAPGIMGGHLIRQLATLTSGRVNDFFLFSYPHRGDIRSVARVVLQGLQTTRDADGEPIREIDIIGISMGGLVARTLALPDQHPLAINTSPRQSVVAIRRIFSLATPHRGANLAAKIALDPAAKAMKPGSTYLRQLDEALATATYDLIPYGTLNDRTVGCKNTAPPGRHPIWLPGAPGFAHSLIHEHPLLILDLALRLRGMPPISREDAPPPRD